jgi:predicted nuclease of restriction endonuclease-like (RecB) superfamily
MKKIIKKNNPFFTTIKSLIEDARQNVVQVVNTTMVYTYFEIGKKIVEEQQQGATRAIYGKGLIEELSTILTNDFGRGWSVDNLERMRRFYTLYSISASDLRKFKNSSKSNPVSITKKSIYPTFKLSWSHYLFLMQIEDVNERKFYEIESIENNWKLNELKRQFNTSLYERLALSRDKKKVKELSTKGHIITKAADLIKEPYILEFLSLKEEEVYSENDLESAIFNKMSEFLLELGKGFTFVARQKRITFDEEHFRIDLVFYNRILKCFVIIDLKLGKLTHQDLGQMQMYVNYYDEEIKLPDENKTVGIVLCRSKHNAIVEYTLPKDNKQIFASQYKMILPSKRSLTNILKKI